MASEWLTLSEVVEQRGRTEKTIRKQVEDGRFPAPHRFRGRGGNAPVWPRAAVENPDEYAVGRKRSTTRVTREMHLAHLLDEVRLYVWKNGTAAIPQAAVGRPDKDDPRRRFPLGARVSALRAAHKHGRLSKAEAEPFEALPEWEWDHWDSTWRARFSEVATRYQTGNLTARDRAWVGNQRRRWGNLRPEWRKLFEAYPGLLEGGRQSRVEEFVAACEVWLAEHPDHTLYAMPYAATVMVDGEKVPVGRRATYYRRRYLGIEGPPERRRRLSAEDAAKIEALPGWTWELSPTHVNAQKNRKKSA